MSSLSSDLKAGVCVLVVKQGWDPDPQSIEGPNPGSNFLSWEVDADWLPS